MDTYSRDTHCPGLTSLVLAPTQWQQTLRGERISGWIAGFPKRAEPHAHSALCVSAAAAQLRSLAGTLQLNRYKVYSRALPAGTLSWPAEDQVAASVMLLEEPADSAGDDMALSDVTMNEIVSMGGTNSIRA